MKENCAHVSQMGTGVLMRAASRIGGGEVAGPGVLEMPGPVNHAEGGAGAGMLLVSIPRRLLSKHTTNRSFLIAFICSTGLDQSCKSASSIYRPSTQQ
jgi:hypothetical protein